MGSKSGIAEAILDALPPAKNFYDLFGGGGAISHCAAAKFRNKWDHVHYSELESDIAQLFSDAIAGKYSYEKFKPEWISREDFNRLKNSDAYVRLVWSFSNIQKKYLFSRENERLKKSLHNAVVFDVWDDTARDLLGIPQWPDGIDTIKQRRLSMKKLVAHQTDLQQLEQLQQLERLERLQQLEQLEQLQRLQQIAISSLSYQDVKIEPDSIIYCDPPYAGTVGYLNKFDHAEFLSWAAENIIPVFISEYEIRDCRFALVYEIEKKKSLAIPMG